MSSTPSAYPQVIRRHFASFRVVKSSISAIQAILCAWFDSRQLHQSKLVKAKSLGQLFFCVKLVPLVEVRPERLGGPELRERHRPLVEGVNRLSFKNPGMAGARDRRRVG